MWIGVRERFRRFAADLHLTTDQLTDGATKFRNISLALERAYFGTADDSHHGLMVGSWGKRTQVRPPNDLDMFFMLPPGELPRLEARVGNVQSALLQEVKSVLAGTYPQTTMRGDGQVVSVGFNTLTVEVVPVFLLTSNQFWMPDTHNGGSWKLADPLAQVERIESVDTLRAGNVRQLAKMVKHWKREKNVPIKSFVLELLVAEFFAANPDGAYDYYWYDWYVRDFLEFLVAKANRHVFIPGTNELYFLGDDWLSRAVTARDVARVACYWEREDYVTTAGQEWQKIFGVRIPASLT